MNTVRIYQPISGYYQSGQCCQCSKPFKEGQVTIEREDWEFCSKRCVMLWIDKMNHQAEMQIKRDKETPKIPRTDPATGRDRF